MAELDDDGPARPRTPAVWSLVMMNVFIAVSMASLGISLLLAQGDGLVAFGALSAREVWAGEVWRLVTAMFVHGGLWHVGLNMWVLVQLGRSLETAIGTARFVVVYLVSGVFGFALSLLVHPGVSAGASGAIFGVTGGLLGIALVTRGDTVGRHIVSTLLPFVVGTLALGFLIPFVDNSAHIGGLVMGTLLGFALAVDVPLSGVRLEPARAARDRRLGAVALVVALALVAVVVPVALRPWFSPTYAVTMAVSALRAGDVDEARARSADASALAPQDGAVLALVGRLALEDARDDESRARARAFFREAITAFDAERADRALSLALASLGRGDDPRLFVIVDEAMTRGLCDAALAAKSDTPLPEVMNNCAWFFVNAHDASDDDRARARALAERAVALTLGERDPSALSAVEKATAAAYLHTHAETLAKTGELDEARATLEKVVAMGLADDPFYVEELDRVRRLAKRRGAAERPANVDAVPVVEPAFEGDGGAGGLAADGGAPRDDDTAAP